MISDGRLMKGRTPTYLIQQWPEDLRAAHDDARQRAVAAVQRGDFEAAVRLFDEAVEVVRKAQPAGRRYHKGESLHNRGLYEIFSGLGAEALRSTTLAFIEDALSLAEEEPHLVELDRPAAHNLVYVFAVPGPVVADAARAVRLAVEAEGCFPDPEDLLASGDVDLIRATSGAAEGKRIPGLFNSAPHDRVFIGGYYGDGLLDSSLRPIRSVVDAMKFDGVLAADFAVPADQGVDEVAITLMRSCHRAIFDFTHGGGHEEEFAALPDTMRGRTLVVFDRRLTAEPAVSGGMTLEKMRRWGLPATPFDSDEERDTTVRDWLSAGD